MLFCLQYCKKQGADPPGTAAGATQWAERGVATARQQATPHCCLKHAATTRWPAGRWETGRMAMQNGPCGNAKRPE